MTRQASSGHSLCSVNAARYGIYARTKPMRFEYRPNPPKVALFLGALSLYLAVQSLIGEYLLENVLSSNTGGIIPLLIDLFSVNAEETIPTWYATLLLFASAMLLVFIAAAKRAKRDPYTGYWIGLAVIFFYLSMDEGAAIHEILADPLQTTFNTTGYLAFGWQIVFVPLVILFVLFYLRFLFHLPSRTRNLFVLAGLLYVGGAVGFESISANQWYVDGGISFSYLAIATVEELLEMVGIVTFIYALLSYMVEMRYTAVISPAFSSQTTTSPENPLDSKRTPWVKRLVKWGVVFIVVLNMALFAWAFRQQAASASGEIPFYQTVSERYAGQGVVILSINEAIEPDNPAAQQVAASLLTLFDDVLVVSMPPPQSSIAFVSHDLPFDQNTLAEIVQQSGETQFAVLDTSAVRAIAGNYQTP